MKGIGKTTYDMGVALNNTLMGIPMLVSFNLERHLATAFISGLMEKNTTGNGTRECGRAKAYGRAIKETSILETGRKIELKASVLTLGLMVFILTQFYICVGDVYEGEWVANRKDGKGTDIFSNGDAYHGEYKEGIPNGFGIYTWKTGSYYEGQFVDGLKHGKGIWRKNKDDVMSNRYEGQYYMDKKHGYGEFTW